MCSTCIFRNKTTYFMRVDCCETRSYITFTCGYQLKQTHNSINITRYYYILCPRCMHMEPYYNKVTPVYHFNISFRSDLWPRLIHHNNSNEKRYMRICTTFYHNVSKHLTGPSATNTNSSCSTDKSSSRVTTKCSPDH